MNIIIERIKPVNAHDEQKWIKLRGRVEGAPESTWKTRAINVAALVDGSLSLASEKEQLRADVEEYYGRYEAVQEGLKLL
jgi:hypothetical protein